MTPPPYQAPSDFQAGLFYESAPPNLTTPLKQRSNDLHARAKNVVKKSCPRRIFA